MSRRPPTRPPAVPPADVETGAALVTAASIKLFDRSDGTGADWRLMTESLFKAAFVMLDGLPEDARRSIARRVQEGSYNRMLPGPVGGDSSTSNYGPAGVVFTPANIDNLQSKEPRPPR